MDQFVTRAIAWIARHLAEFDPFKDGQAFEIKNGQRVGELAILLHAYANLTGRRNSNEAKKIASLLVSIQQKPQFADRMMRSPPEFILFAEVYASLRSAGHDSLQQRRLLQRAIDAGFLNFTERLPHRVMDVVSCLGRADLRHSLPGLEVLFRRSILSPVPCPMLMDEDALYFLTHVIMFVFDFGVRQTIQLKRAYKAKLQESLSALIVAMCQDHHWDLLAELLVCWDCVGLPHTDTYKRAWRLLRRMQRADGAVPGPEWASRLFKQMNQQSGSTPSVNFLFDHHYHTTLVCVIAGALRNKRLKLAATAEMRRRREPSAAPSRETSSLLGRFEGAPQKVERALRRTRDWLASLLENDSSGRRNRPEVFSAVILGIWICESGSPASPKLDPRSLLARTMISGSQDLTQESAWARTPPFLKLVLAGLLEQHGAFIPALHGKDGFVSRAAKALARRVGKSRQEELTLVEKRIALHQMGLLSRPRPARWAELWRACRGFDLGDSDEAVEGLLQLCNAHTLYGLEDLSHRPEHRDVGHRLCEIAVSRLRKYDLLSGSRLLRGALGFDRNSLLSRTCIDFLLLQQKPDGSFGFLGSEEHRLHAKEHGGRPDAAVDLYLPISLQCAWTLAEATGQWCLMRGLARPQASSR